VKTFALDLFLPGGLRLEGPGDGTEALIEIEYGGDEVGVCEEEEEKEEAEVCPQVVGGRVRG
jgi:hypothetical protein